MNNELINQVANRICDKLADTDLSFTEYLQGNQEQFERMLAEYWNFVGSIGHGARSTSYKTLYRILIRGFILRNSAVNTEDDACFLTLQFRMADEVIKAQKQIIT